MGFLKTSFITFLLIVPFIADYYQVRNCIRYFVTDDFDSDHEIKGIDPPGKYALLSHGLTHYLLTGPEDGEILVFLPGISAPPFIEAKVFMDSLNEAGYRVLTLDYYGRAFSATAQAPYTASLFVSQVSDLLLYLESPGRELYGKGGAYHFLGYSLGAVTLAEFNKRFPDKVKSFTFVSPSGLPVEMDFIIQLSRAPIIGDLIPRSIVRQGLVDFYEKEKRSENGRKNAPVLLEFLLRVFDTKPGYYRSVLSTLRHFPLSESHDALINVGVSGKPVTVFWGDTDTTTPYRNAPLFQELIPQAKLHTIPGAGHHLLSEYPHVVAPGVIEHLVQCKAQAQLI